MKKITLLFILFITLSVSSQTFDGSTGAIPDNNCDATNEFVVSVSFVGVLGAANSFGEVAINITHTFDGDLDITLIAPDATAVELSTDNGSSGDNYTDTHFSNLAGTSITTGSAPFTGSFLPEGDLSILNGVDADGNWILRVCDDAGSDIGTLDSWSITFIPTLTDTADWNNLQWPDVGAITTGDNYDVYAKIYEGGLTDVTVGSQAPGIEAWVGYDTADTDPSAGGWIWIASTFNVEAGNDDEYITEIGSGLAAGTYYYASRFRVNGGPFTYGGYNAGGGGFWDGTTNVSGILTVTDPPPPANDVCANATPYLNDFTMFAEGNCVGTPNMLDLTTATDDATSDTPSCDASGNYGVWYTWTATSTGLTFTPGAGLPGLAVYEAGTCGTLVEVGCRNNDAGIITGLTVSNDYLLHIWDDTAGNAVDFCLEELTPAPPPANDDCANAITITASVDNSCANAVSGTTVSATNSADYSPSCGSTYNEVWYTFTPGTSEIFNITRTINSGTGSTYLSIWTGSCGSLTRVNTSCFSTSLAESLTSGTTYLISVATADIGAVDFDLCIYPNPPAPGNDECATATALTVNADLNCGSFVSGTVASATASADAEACTGTYDDDVWYSFVAVGTEHVVQVNNIAGSTSDLVFQLAEGTCGSLIELGCYDTPNSGFTATGLTPTNTYYVRVATWSSSSQDTTFDICIGTEAAFVPDYLNDFASYPGSGWTEASGVYGTPTGTSSDWLQDDFGNDVAHLNGRSARINVWGTSKDEYLVSPNFDLSGSTYYLNFDIALTEFGNTNAATLGVDDYVALLVTEDGTNWSELTRWDSNSSITTSRQAANEITLSGYGANVKFAFYAFSDTSNEDNDFFLDNFQITSTTLGIGDNTIEGFTMYPNPTKGLLNLNALETINAVSIYSLLGQEVMRVQPNTLKSQVDISNLSTGMYVVKVQVGDKVGSYRIIKQ